MTPSLFMDSGATFSDCGKYRHMLWRIWDEGLPLLMLLMLNPSTAGETANDPTVARQITRARMLGMGGLLVGNIFDFRATDPEVMKNAASPCSAENNYHILQMAERSIASGGKIICAWGTHGSHRGRSAEVVGLLAGMPLHALKVTAGEPHHPLYIKLTDQPFRWPKEQPKEQPKEETI